MKYYPNNPKIDLYGAKGNYLYSTNFAKTCKEALSHFQAKYKGTEQEPAKAQRARR